MRTITAFRLLTDGYQELIVNKGCKFLSVGLSNGEPTIYVSINPMRDFESHPIWVFRTGQPIECPEPLRFLGTLHAHGGSSASHVFCSILD